MHINEKAWARRKCNDTAVLYMVIETLASDNGKYEYEENIVSALNKLINEQLGEIWTDEQEPYGEKPDNTWTGHCHWPGCPISITLKAGQELKEWNWALVDNLPFCVNHAELAKGEFRMWTLINFSLRYRP